MRRQVCWVEKLEDGVRREIRVSFPGGRKLKWQFKRSDSPLWDYDSPPSAEDWAQLLERAEHRYNRRRMPISDVDLIKTLMREALR